MITESHHKQKGVTLVITALALTVILGIAGLAIDLGHSYSLKTRLQNSIDAGALSAATSILKQIQKTPPTSATPVDVSNTSAAVLKAIGTVKANLAGDHFWGMNTTTSNVSATFCVSTSLQDFSNPNPNCLTQITSPINNYFVKATAIDTGNNNSHSIPLRTFIIQVLGFTQKSVGASAVAGLKFTSPTTATSVRCNLSPFFVCNNSNSTDKDCSDGSCFGNTVGNYYLLKASSQCPTNCQNITISGNPSTDYPTASFDGTSGALSPNTSNGQYMMIDNPQSNSGASGVQEAVVNPTACVGNTFQTQNGNASSIKFPLNAIFGLNQTGGLGNDPYASNYSDFVTTQHIKFATYNSTSPYPLDILPGSGGRAYRRVLATPVANCGTSRLTGPTTLTVVGYACWFLPEPQVGNGNDSYFSGELIGQNYCGLTTGSTITGNGTPGSSIDIVLYDDPLNNDE